MEQILDGSPVYSRVGLVDGLLVPELWDGSEPCDITLI